MGQSTVPQTRVPSVSDLPEPGQGVAGGIAVGNEGIKGFDEVGARSPWKSVRVIEHGEGNLDALADVVFHHEGQRIGAATCAEHAVGGGVGGSHLDQFRKEVLQVGQIQPISGECGNGAAVVTRGQQQTGAERGIEVGGFWGIDGVGRQLIEENIGECGIAELQGVGPIDDIRVGGGIGDEGVDQSVAMGADGAGVVVADGGGGLLTDPVVGITIRSIEHADEGGQGGGVLADAEGLGGALANVGIRAGKQAAQVGEVGGGQGAGGEFDRGVMTHDGVIIAEGGEKLGNRQAGAIHAEVACGNRVGDFGGVERVGRVGVFSGDVESFEREAVGEEVDGGAFDTGLQRNFPGRCRRRWSLRRNSRCPVLS